MEPKAKDGFEPELDRAKQKLAAALSEACEADVKRLNTGELIRIEEVLAIANEAAKTAVSIRRRRSRHLNEVAESDAAEDEPEASADDQAPPADAVDAVGAPGELDLPDTHRIFRDSAGTRWDAFAVYPGAETQGRSRLPDPYRSGWLAFECEQEKRRLSPVPDGWRSLPDAKLLELCEGAERVRRRGAQGGERRPTDD